MAYPVESSSVVTAAATSCEVTLPSHLEDDVVFLVIGQDAPSAATFTLPGSPWTLLSSAQNGGARYAVLYAVAGATALASPTITSTLSDEWTAIVVVVRDADVSNPIDAWSYGYSTSLPINSPPLTTVTPNCLLLGMTVEDGLARHRFNLDQIMPMEAVASTGSTSFVGYSLAETAGPCPGVSDGWGNSVDACHFLYVAVKNASGGQLPPKFIPPIELARYYTSSLPITTEAPQNITSVINGYPVNSSNLSAPALAVSNISGAWSLAAQPSFSTMPAGYPTQWIGYVHNITPADFTDGLFSCQLAYPSINAALIASRAVMFVDAAGAWGAWELPKNFEIPTNSTVQDVVIDLVRVPALDKSAQDLNLTNIVKIGFVALRRASSITTVVSYNVILPLLWKGVRVYGGSSASPVDLNLLAKAWKALYSGVISYRGGRQFAVASKIILGDGVTHSVIKIQDGASISFVEKSPAFRIEKESFGFVIHASSTDSVILDNTAIGSSSGAALAVSPGSSPSASYSTSGTSLFGMEAVFQPGVEISGGNFFECPTIDGGFAAFHLCRFSRSLSAVAMSSGSPSNISNCTFTQGASGGHAIEITQPGTFAFVGNTFSGYGLDGTTDAAIYNNSGGHVTLNVSGGGDTPTVRNGAGATTNVVSGAQIAVVGLAAGSQVKVTKVSNGDVLFNGAEAGGQISFSTTYIGAIRIDARKASASPFYKPWFSQANTVSGQVVEITALQELDE